MHLHHLRVDVLLLELEADPVFDLPLHGPGDPAPRTVNAGSAPLYYSRYYKTVAIQNYMTLPYS